MTYHDRRFIADAVHADAQLDLSLLGYAEHGRRHDLADALRLSHTVYESLKKEAIRSGNRDLLNRETR